MQATDVQAPPDLSLVVLQYNTHELVEQCLASLLKVRGTLRLEVIVVDNASPRGGIDSVIEAMAPRFTDVGCDLILLRAPRNLGFTGGNNLGLRQARASLLALLNNDTIVHAGCLQAVVEHFRRSPGTLGIVGPRLLNADGSHQASCRSFPSLATALFNRDSWLTRKFPGNPWSRGYLMPDASEATEALPVDWVSGAALFISRACLARVGWMDERYFMYAEDVDWCRSAQSSGFTVEYLPRARITHLVGQSSGHLPFRTIVWRHQSMWTYYRKHISRRIALFDLATLAGIACRCGMKVAQAAIGGVGSSRKLSA